MEGSHYTRRDFLKATGKSTLALAASGCMKNAESQAHKNSKERPNILWITCEDINPYLGCYGDRFAITPNIDKLASEAALYTNAYATAPVCAPSRSCLITGIYATSLGTQHLRSRIQLPGKIKCFTEYLRQAGYYCSNNYKKDYNFIDTSAWDESSHHAHWRNRRPSQPFFSVFNFTSTHQGQINGTDEEFFEKYGSRLTPEERHDPAEVPLPPYYPDTPLIRKIWARYYDLITYMDKQVKDLLAQLEEDGLTANTIVFFFADHGLGVPRHKRTLYDSGLHVPLLIRFPQRYQHLSPVKNGHKTDRLVSFVDFAPTVLSLTDLPVPNYMRGRVFLGRRTAAPRRYVFGATSRVDEVYELSRSVRDKRYKYIRNYMPHLPNIQPSEYPDRAEIMQELRRVIAEGKLTGPQKLFWEPGKLLEELYDTRSDPHEIHNLAGSPGHRYILKRMRQVLRKWVAHTHDIGFLPEAEMHIRAKGSTPYEIARQPDTYPQRRILAAADLVGRGPEHLDELIKFSKDDDGAVRYWAILAISVLPTKPPAARQVLQRALTDEQPNARFAAAGALCKLGLCEDALPVLAQGLQHHCEPAVLYAAREIQGIGSKAAPLVPLMKEIRQRCKNSDGSYKDDRYAMFVDWALKYALQNCRE
jgi:uncharacterized sulfatase